MGVPGLTLLLMLCSGSPHACVCPLNTPLAVPVTCSCQLSLMPSSPVCMSGHKVSILSAHLVASHAWKTVWPQSANK